MRNPGRIAAIVVALVLAMPTTRAAEADKVSGRTAEEWVTVVLDPASTFDQRSAANRALFQLGQQAHAVVPKLLAAMKGENGEVAHAAGLALGTMRDPEAIAPLTVMLGDEKYKHRAAHALAAYGPEGKAAEPIFLEELKSKDDVEQLSAAHALGSIHADPKKSVAAILAAFRVDLEPAKDRFGASPMLPMRLGEMLLPFGAEAVGPLTAMLDDPNPEIWHAAFYALPKFGAAAAPAAEKIARHLSDPTKGWRESAAQGLGKIGPAAAATAVPLADAAAKETEYLTCRRMLEALGDFGPAAGPAVPKMIEMLSAPADSAAGKNRDSIIHTLGLIGPPAAPALPALAAIVKKPFAAAVPQHDESYQRNLAAEAIALIDPNHPQGIAALIESARRSDEGSDDAVERLSGLGSAAKAALPALVELASDEKARAGEKEDKVVERRALALEAIMKIGADAACVPPLMEIVKKSASGNSAEGAQLGGIAAAALGSAGPAAKEAVPLLVSLCEKRGYGPIYYAFCHISPDAHEATAVLRAGLKDHETWSRIYCALGLLKMDANEAEARSVLMDEFSHLPEKMKVEQEGASAGEAAMFERDFCDACGILGPAVREYAPQLESLAKTNHDPEIRRKAEAALKKVGGA